MLLALVSGCDGAGPSGASFPDVTYRTSGTDEATGVTKLANGDLAVYGIAEGRLAPADGTNAFPLVLRLRPDGSIAASTIYRDEGYGRVAGAAALGEGLAVLTVTRGGDGVSRGEPTLTVYQTNPNGERTRVLYTQPNTSTPTQSLLRTPDEGLLLVAYAFGDAENDVIKLDGPGSVGWTYDMPGVQDVRAAAVAPNGDVFVLGAVDSYRFAVARLSPSGQERWRRTYGDDSAIRQLKGLAAIGDGAAVLIDRLVEGSRAIQLTRLSNSGDVRWERAYATGSVRATAVAALDEQRLAVAWTEDTAPDQVGGYRAKIARLNRQGEVSSRYSFGPQDHTSTRVTDMLALSDNNFVAVGATGPERLGGFGGDDFDVLITRFAETP
jgi:hypothetical protein